jgi:hypothetical protein
VLDCLGNHLGIDGWYAGRCLGVALGMLWEMFGDAPGDALVMFGECVG